jgi:hypothetical protein
MSHKNGNGKVSDLGTALRQRYDAARSGDASPTARERTAGRPAREGAPLKDEGTASLDSPAPEPGAGDPKVKALHLIAQARAHGAVLLLDDDDPDGFAVVGFAPLRERFEAKGAQYAAELRRLAPHVRALLLGIQRRDPATTTTTTPAPSAPAVAPTSSSSRKNERRVAVARLVRFALRGRLPGRDDAHDRAMQARDAFARLLFDYLKPRCDKGADVAAFREGTLAWFVNVSGFVAARQVKPREFRAILKETLGLKPGGRAIHFRARLGALMSQASATICAAENHSQVLLRLASSLECFRSLDNRPFATLSVNGHRETHDLASPQFRSWLVHAFYREQRKPPTTDALQGALQVLESQALFEGKEQTVATRIAPGDGQALYLDLGDPHWHAVRVDAQGWAVTTEPAVKFRRPRGLQPLPMPERDGDGHTAREFLRFCNVAEDDGPLLLAWMTAAMLPTGPYPLLLLTGEQGSAKSTLARLVRRLIDPHVSELRAEPKDLRDLMISATNAWIVAFDNVSKITTHLSDTLCRLSTGGGFATRAMFTDADEVFLDAQRPVILTSIDDVVTRPDLSERVVQLRLPMIADRERRFESQLLREFEAARPRLLGGLLTAVAAGLRTCDAIKLKAPPRLADFARWGEAVCRHLGYAPGEFLSRYDRNRRDAYASLLDGSPLVAALEALARLGTFQGTPNQLLAALGEHQPSGTSQHWPRTARALGSILRRLAPAIRSGGVDVTFGLGRQQREILVQIVAQPSPT